MKCGPLTLKQANNGCCRSSLIPFSQTKVFTPSYQASQASSFCWGSSYLMSYHTASRSISWLHGRGVTGEDITEIILCSLKIVKIITHFCFSFRADYLKMYRQRTRSDLEGFNNFMAQGVRTEYLESVFPAESFPAWQTIQTGKSCQILGLVAFLG